jgi:peptidoglycan/LPS O-acetylase OafA/YrhL
LISDDRFDEDGSGHAWSHARMTAPNQTTVDTDTGGGHHVAALDGIRGLAILSVMLFHFSGGADYSFYLHVCHLGWMGVDLFFVLSGFLITGILIDAKESRGYFKNFYARRILRIFPVCYAFLIFMMILARFAWPQLAIAGLGQAAHYWPWWFFYGSNILVARIGWVCIAMDQFWSLAIEEHFYLVWPAIVFFTNLRTLKRICVGGVIFSLLLRLFINWHWHRPIACYALTPCRLEGLCLGAYCAAVSRRFGLSRSRGPAWIILFAGGAGVLAAILLQRDTYGLNWAMYTFGYTFVDLLCAGFLVLALTGHPQGPLRRILAGRFLGVLGKYSYGMYMFHTTVYALLYYLLPAATIAGFVHSRGLGMAIFIGIGCGLTFLWALASWHGLEKHALKMKRYFQYTKPGANLPQVQLSQLPATDGRNIKC